MNKAFLFSFEKYAGFDRVFFVEGKESKKLSSGDLIQIEGDSYLVLGDNIPFKEIYRYPLKSNLEDREVVEKKLLSDETMKLLHFVVYEYYSTYRKALNLFIDFDIKKLEKEKIKKNASPYFQKAFLKSDSFIEFGEENLSGQQLIVFPDLWTLKQNINTEKMEQNKDIICLYGASTSKQKNKAFRQLKKGKFSTLLCTHSQLFKCWNNLERIIMIDSHKWYYKNQQEPRYSTFQVLKKLSELQGTEFQEYGFRLF